MKNINNETIIKANVNLSSKDSISNISSILFKYFLSSSPEGKRFNSSFS